MLEIINEKYLRSESDTIVVRAELCVDSAEELPEADGIAGRLLAAGSLAWDISTGDIYGLTGAGEWAAQTGGNS